MRRRNLLGLIAAGLATGCKDIGDSTWFGKLSETAQGWHRGVHRALGVSRIEMSPEYDRADISPFFRGNGSTSLSDERYRASMASGFADWTLRIFGLVENPLDLTLAELRDFPQRTQITRHDCVEGWSAIGEWTGPQLGPILDLAKLQESARFIVFHCADTLSGMPYYESCDLDDAHHPQTIIAHALNGEPLPERNGAPLRLRLERQLGYKHAKYLTGIEAVASLDGFGQGKGGFWEDRGYQWYAGI